MTWILPVKTHTSWKHTWYFHIKRIHQLPFPAQPRLTCWISLSWWLILSRRCLRSVSEESNSRRMELLWPSACCNFCSRSSTSEWAILKRSSKSLFSCSCESRRRSQHRLPYRALNSCSGNGFTCLCGHELLNSGHFCNVRVDPELELILLMQHLLHLRMHSLYRQKHNRGRRYFISFWHRKINDK